jgi:hypothetical protein
MMPLDMVPLWLDRAARLLPTGGQVQAFALGLAAAVVSRWISRKGNRR